MFVIVAAVEDEWLIIKKEKKKSVSAKQRLRFGKTLMCDFIKMNQTINLCIYYVYTSKTSFFKTLVRLIIFFMYNNNNKNNANGSF